MNFKHGDARVGGVTRLHRIWRKMLTRVNPDRAKPHPDYAGRGITVCVEWRTFTTFRDWAMANGYDAGLTIERRDNDGNYEPGNCRWATRGEQTRNRRSSRFIELNGRKMILADWSRETGLSSSLIAPRLRVGWSTDRALTEGARL